MAMEREMLASGQSRQSACVIGIFSVQGGVGKSLLAANLAAGLAGLQPGKVGLVDFDVRGGAGLADQLGLTPTVTLFDWLCHPPGAQVRLWEYFVSHRCGFWLLAGTHEPYRLASFSPSEIAARVEELGAAFRYLIFDLQPGLDDLTITLLRRCRLVFVPIRRESVGTAAVRFMMRHLDWAGLAAGCRWVTWESPLPGRPMRARTLPASIGPVLVLPWSPLVVAEATACGRLPTERPYTDLGRSLRQWAAEVYQETNSGCLPSSLVQEAADALSGGGAEREPVANTPCLNWNC